MGTVRCKKKSVNSTKPYKMKWRWYKAICSQVDICVCLLDDRSFFFTYIYQARSDTVCYWNKQNSESTLWTLQQYSLTPNISKEKWQRCHSYTKPSTNSEERTCAFLWEWRPYCSPIQWIPVTSSFYCQCQQSCML